MFEYQIEWISDGRLELVQVNSSCVKNIPKMTQ